MQPGPLSVLSLSMSPQASRNLGLESFWKSPTTDKLYGQNWKNLVPTLMEYNVTPEDTFTFNQENGFPSYSKVPHDSSQTENEIHSSSLRRNLLNFAFPATALPHSHALVFVSGSLFHKPKFCWPYLEPLQTTNTYLALDSSAHLTTVWGSPIMYANCARARLRTERLPQWWRCDRIQLLIDMYFCHLIVQFWSSFS